MKTARIWCFIKNTNGKTIGSHVTLVTLLALINIVEVQTSVLAMDTEYSCLASQWRKSSKMYIVCKDVDCTMVDVAAVDSHYARKFEKCSKIQSFTHFAITIVTLLKYYSR